MYLYYIHEVMTQLIILNKKYTFKRIQKGTGRQAKYSLTIHLINGHPLENWSVPLCISIKQLMLISNSEMS